MTDPQRRILTFIAEATARDGFPPTVREIAVACELSLSHTQRILDQLEAEGAITRNRGAMRTIRVMDVAPVDRRVAE